MPREKKKDFNYFDYFCTTADLICEASNYLHKSLKEFDISSFRISVDGMHEIENRADSQRHLMIKRLMHEFLPPIEREDIIALASKLDDIVDSIDDVMRRIYMFNVTDIKKGVFEFSELIVKCTSALKDAMDEFKSYKSNKLIQEKLVEINTLESYGDSLHSELLRDLFVNEKDTRNLIKWMNIYEDLESCLDQCEDVSDIIESVIMKNT